MNQIQSHQKESGLVQLNQIKLNPVKLSWIQTNPVESNSVKSNQIKSIVTKEYVEKWSDICTLRCQVRCGNPNNIICLVRTGAVPTFGFP